MPTLQLDGSIDDIAWTRALMVFPSDTSNRDFLFARLKTETQIQGMRDESQLVVDAKALRLLLDAPKGLSGLRMSNIRKGLMAGEILAMVYVMAKATNVLASVNKAVHACVAHGASGATWGDGTPFPTSPSVFRQAWTSHRAVSHFWAAIRLNDYHPFAPPNEILGSYFSTFLRVTAGLLKFGCGFVPEKTTPPAPLLHFEKCWTLPASIDPIEPENPRVPTLLLALLKGYKAPQPM